MMWWWGGVIFFLGGGGRGYKIADLYQCSVVIIALFAICS